MNVQRIASFSLDGLGGNPAGVVIVDRLPSAKEMQSTAKIVGYSETVFAMPSDDGFKARYFAPTMEVPFCGHATIALGAALGKAYGAGNYALDLAQSKINVEAFEENGVWCARLTSPKTYQSEIPEPELQELLGLFGWTAKDLCEIAPSYAHAGADHALLFLSNPEHLKAMSYDFEQGRNLMNRLGLVTINCLWRESKDIFHSRNAFASGGVVEDPATGAAAAALAGYLRDQRKFSSPFTVVQGVDMGSPSRLVVEALPKNGSGILVAGQTRLITGT